MASPNPSPAFVARPTCPSVLIPFENELYSLPIQQMRINIEFNVSTAFVRINATWKNIAKYKSDCMFVLPLNGTVTEAKVQIHSRLFETIIIPKDEAEKCKKKDEEIKEDWIHLPPMTFEDYVPNFFRLPISGVASTEIISVNVVYIEPLTFNNGMYQFSQALKFSDRLIPGGKKMSDVLSLHCVINSVTSECKFESSTHDLRVINNQAPRIELEVAEWNNLKYVREMKAQMASQPTNPSTSNVVPSAGNAGSAGTATQGGRRSSILDAAPGAYSFDFKIAYAMVSTHTLPTLILEPTTPLRALDVDEKKEEKKDDEGNFLLFVTPPSLENLDGFFSRDIIFLLDRSGSMTGDPYSEAVRSLFVALQTLKETDRFNISAFDHKQVWFSPDIVDATQQNVAKALSWIRGFPPQGGGTDIHTPLSTSLKKLNESNQSNNNLIMPFVMLITDGCVADERQICHYVNGHCNRVRLLTLGIGSFCNWFFLKMLSQIGSGFSDVVVYKEKIYEQMVQLVTMASVPVLTQCKLEVPGIKEVELYPFPVPDLFIGAPLTVSGRYKGEFPQEVYLTGKKANGEMERLIIRPRVSDVIPVFKVFVKQRLDLLTARAWLEQNQEIENMVVDISCQQSIPSAYTTMVAYETTDEKNQKDDSIAAQKMMKNVRWYRNPKVIGALVAGNAVIVGAALFSFGDLSASLGNLPLGSLFGQILGADGCCDVCGDCGCDCGACISF